MEENTCPKQGCGKPASTHRWSAGKKLSICGNAHSWDPKEVAEQRAKAAERRDEAASFEGLRGEIDSLKRGLWGPGMKP